MFLVNYWCWCRPLWNCIHKLITRLIVYRLLGIRNDFDRFNLFFESVFKGKSLFLRSDFPPTSTVSYIFLFSIVFVWWFEEFEGTKQLRRPLMYYRWCFDGTLQCWQSYLWLLQRLWCTTSALRTASSAIMITYRVEWGIGYEFLVITDHYCPTQIFRSFFYQPQPSCVVVFSTRIELLVLL